MSKKILLVGGGTGGHAVPLLNLVKYFIKVQSAKCKVQNDGFESTHDQLPTTNYQFHWVGEKESLESKLSTENGIPFSPIVCGKLRRYFSLTTLLLPFQVSIGVLQSLAILVKVKPDAIFSKGGYVSLPVAIAGAMKRIPIYLHESDSIPGLANRIVAKFATGIFSAFPEADKYFKSEKIMGHGPILSPDIMEIARERVIPQERMQLLISCGSQGSRTILKELKDIILDLRGIDIHIILGLQNLDLRNLFLNYPNVSLYDFFYDQKEYLRLVNKCDVVIARSGSGIFEFEAFDLHMILVPHPYTGNNHQYWNAKAFEKKGHDLIPQSELYQKLLKTIDRCRTFKKSPEKTVVDMIIFDTIAKILN